MVADAATAERPLEEEKSAAPGPEAFEVLAQQFHQWKHFVRMYCEIKWQQLNLSLKQMLLAAVVFVLGSVVLAGAFLIGLVFLLQGAMRGLSLALGEYAWLSPLLVGLAVVLICYGLLMRLIASVEKNAKKRLLASYAQAGDI